MKPFTEPSSGCTANVSVGESSRAKEPALSPMQRYPEKSPIPDSLPPLAPKPASGLQKNLIRDFGDRGVTKEASASRSLQSKGAGTSDREGSGAKTFLDLSEDDQSGKRKPKEMADVEYSTLQSTEGNTQDTCSSEDKTPSAKVVSKATSHSTHTSRDGDEQGERGEVREFAQKVQTFCSEMLDSPIPKKSRGIVRKATGHQMIDKEDEISKEVLGGKGATKKLKTSASEVVLKERFERRQTRHGGSPDETTKGKQSAGEGSKKLKKKKV